MAWTKRTKAFAFSTVLILVSTGFVVSAAAENYGLVEPFLSGREYPEERALTRHGVALAVIVGAFDEGDRTRVAGAEVTVSRIRAADSTEASAVETKTTDEQGRALFHVRPGFLRVDVTWDGHVATESFRVGHSQRIGLYFDQDGNPHWISADHGSLERRGDTVALLVQVAENESGRRAPVSGATVSVYRINPDAPEEAELVESKTTGPRGAALFQVPQGPYRVVAEWNGTSASDEMRLHHDARVFFLFDGGEVHVDHRAARAAGERPAPRER